MFQGRATRRGAISRHPLLVPVLPLLLLPLLAHAFVPPSVAPAPLLHRAVSGVDRHASPLLPSSPRTACLPWLKAQQAASSSSKDSTVGGEPGVGQRGHAGKLSLSKPSAGAALGSLAGGLAVVAAGGVAGTGAACVSTCEEALVHVGGLGGLQLADAAGASLPVEALVGGMLAGAVAGAAVDIVLYPIDTVKTRLQTVGSIDLKPSEVGQLYSGLLGGLVGHVPSSALFFAVYETSRVLYLEPVFGLGSASSQLIASALGNVAASTIRVPTEVVKTRLQSGAESDLSSAVSNILNRDGPLGLFRGYAAFLLRDLPFDAIEFVAYEQLKIAYAASLGLGVGSLGGPQTALIGAVAGGITGALTTPLDTVRARQMNEAGEGDKGYGGILESMARIVEEGGWQGLFAGVKPRVLWLSLGGTVFFSSLEAAKSAFMK